MMRLTMSSHNVINYDRPVLNLIAGLDATGHVTHTAYKKTSVTLHHNAGRNTHESVLAIWKYRPASAHFNVDGHGTVAQYVRVNEYAWSTGNSEGNRTSISIELVNKEVSPSWEIAEPTWRGGARLAGWLFANVIGERPTKDNLHQHKDWASTTCAGPWMAKVYDQALKVAQDAYDSFVKPPATTKPTPAPAPAKPSPSPSTRNTRLVERIQRHIEVSVDGEWGPKTDRRAVLMRAASKNKHGWPENTGVMPDIKVVQAVIDTNVDGRWGSNSQSQLIKWIKQMQNIMNVASDGNWGPRTDGKFLQIRRRQNGNY